MNRFKKLFKKKENDEFDEITIKSHSVKKVRVDDNDFLGFEGLPESFRKILMKSKLSNEEFVKNKDEVLTILRHIELYSMNQPPKYCSLFV